MALFQGHEEARYVLMLGEKVMNELVIAKKLNNQLVPLSYPVRKGDKVEFISLTSRSGMRIYEQSLTLVLIRAVKELFPGARLIVQHSLSRALYCEIGAIRKIDQRDVQKIETRMKKSWPEMNLSKILLYPSTKQSISSTNTNSMIRFNC